MAKSAVFAAKMRAALAPVLHHPAEGERNRHGYQQNREHSRKLLNGVGFSKGWAEFTPKNPPPLLPSCLMAICEAAGPMGMIWSFPSRVTACT